MGADGPPRDHLLTSQLKAPMLDEYMASQVLRAEMLSIANEVKRRYVAKVPKDSGNLASTARTSAERSRLFRDRRWEGVFDVGGPRADYADDIEREYGILGEVLAEMGFGANDRIEGPRGKIRDAEKTAPSASQRAEEAKAAQSQRRRQQENDRMIGERLASLADDDDMVTLYHRTDRPAAESIEREQRFRSAPYTGGYAFFALDRNFDEGWGRSVVSVRVPRSSVRPDRHPDVVGLGAVKVATRDLSGREIRYERQGGLDDGG